MTFAREIKCTFIETSAKSGENVTSMFTELAAVLSGPEAPPPPEHPSGCIALRNEGRSEPAESRNDPAECQPRDRRTARRLLLNNRKIQIDSVLTQSDAFSLTRRIHRKNKTSQLFLINFSVQKTHNMAASTFVFLLLILSSCLGSTPPSSRERSSPGIILAVNSAVCSRVDHAIVR